MSDLHTILKMQAKGFQRRDKEEYDNYSEKAILRRVDEVFQNQSKELELSVVRDFSAEYKESSIFKLKRQEVKTLCFYLRKEKPEEYIFQTEYNDVFFLIQKYENYFLDFKKEHEKLMKLKNAMRPISLV